MTEERKQGIETNVALSLEARLAVLSRDVTPPTDLWPGIARRVRPSRRVVWLMSAAACLSACVATAVTWAVLHSSPHPADVQGALAGLGFDAPATPALLAARATLEQDYRARLALLEPATRTTIEANLAVIRQAHQEILKALATAPGNPLLTQLLASTWRDEFDLYDQVVQATQPTQTRI